MAPSAPPLPGTLSGAVHGKRPTREPAGMGNVAGAAAPEEAGAAEVADAKVIVAAGVLRAMVGAVDSCTWARGRELCPFAPEVWGAGAAGMDAEIAMRRVRCGRRTPPRHPPRSARWSASARACASRASWTRLGRSTGGWASIASAFIRGVKRGSRPPKPACTVGALGSNGAVVGRGLLGKSVSVRMKVSVRGKVKESEGEDDGSWIWVRVRTRAKSKVNSMEWALGLARLESGWRCTRRVDSPTRLPVLAADIRERESHADGSVDRSVITFQRGAASESHGFGGRRVRPSARGRSGR